VALAALLFCFVIVVPYLRDRINRIFDESGERRMERATNDKGEATCANSIAHSEGGSYLAFTSRPFAFFRRLWNKVFLPTRAVEVIESDHSQGRLDHYMIPAGLFALFSRTRLSVRLVVVVAAQKNR
jgi:hypothetical protein